MNFDPSVHLAAAYAEAGSVVTRADGREFLGVLSAPDREAFDGMALNTEYRLRHPALPDPLVVNELLTIDGVTYRVREPSRAFGRGLQVDTSLTRL